MSLMGLVKRKFWLPFELVENYRCERLTKINQINHNFKRIYFYHVRKSGGTSLNQMFLSLNNQDGEKIYNRMLQSPTRRVIVNHKIFVGWNRKLIEQGNYFYAFSHAPEHKLVLPEDTFTITCLRNPLARVISHYKMLLEFKQNNIPHPSLKIEGTWLGNKFADFIDNIPKEHLLRQVFMFSQKFDPDEAFEKILKLSYFFFTEDFNAGVDELSSKLNLSLYPVHVKKSSVSFSITPTETEELSARLEPEILLYNKLKKYKMQHNE